MKRGEIWWAALPAPRGTLPVLLIARDEFYGHLKWGIVAPLTSRLRRLPIAVLLTPEEDAVPERSVVHLDHIMLDHRSWLRKHAPSLRSDRKDAIDEALHFALALR